MVGLRSTRPNVKLKSIRRDTDPRLLRRKRGEGCFCAYPSHHDDLGDWVVPDFSLVFTVFRLKVVSGAVVGTAKEPGPSAGGTGRGLCRHFSPRHSITPALRGAAAASASGDTAVGLNSVSNQT